MANDNTPHTFVTGAFQEGEQGGRAPEETCQVCGKDPRNLLHKQAVVTPLGDAVLQVVRCAVSLTPTNSTTALLGLLLEATTEVARIMGVNPEQLAAMIPAYKRSN